MREGEGWDTAGAQCLHPVPSNHRLVTPGWWQLGLQAGSEHSQFLPGCLGKEESVTASRHRPGTGQPAGGQRRGACKAKPWGQSIPGPRFPARTQQCQCCRAPHTRRAVAPLAEAAGRAASAWGASQTGYAEGQAARWCQGREGRATSQSQEPGSQGTSAGAQRPTRHSAPPVTAPLAGGGRADSTQLPCQQPASGERRLGRQNDADPSYRDRLFPSSPTRSVPALAPDCHRLPGSRGSGQWVAPAGSGVGQACTAEGTDVTTCP